LRGHFYYSAKVIPDRGAWLEFETDAAKNIIWVRIDRQRKIPATALLRVFGFGSDVEILDQFKKDKEIMESKYIQETIEKDPSASEDEGLIEVYQKIRPGDLATVDNARSLIYAMFLNHSRYDLSKVGRYKLNQRLHLDPKINKRTLRPEDLIAIISELIHLNVRQSPADDVDHLSNRRVRAIGELVQNRMRVGMLRLQRIVRDRMGLIDSKKYGPAQLVNIKPIVGVIREFFMSSQLSQFMDQTNILSELEHKRRLTVVGPGGLSRDRAGFEVRDVHRTYYGKICPIATPEGPNVGLVNYLACYSRLNEYGFIETPYYKVKNGKITDEIVYFNAFEEEEHILMPFTAQIDQNRRIIDQEVEARIYGQPGFCDLKEVEYVDVAANQIVSVSTALIPFLENDDGVRALMGSNMQRQAVPLLRPEAPLVGTGVESRVAQDSGHLLIAEEDGEVTEVDSQHICLRYK